MNFIPLVLNTLVNAEPTPENEDAVTEPPRTKFLESLVFTNGAARALTSLTLYGAANRFDAPALTPIIVSLVDIVDCGRLAIGTSAACTDKLPIIKSVSEILFI